METWVLAGQSNMEGRGLLGDLRATLKPVDGVRTLNSAGEWEVAADPLQRHWESFTPVHRTLARSRLDERARHLTDAELARRDRRETGRRRGDRPQARPGAGLGVAFGQALAEAKGTEIGLIPAAHGGTTLDQWRVGQLPDGGRSLSGSLVERVQRARATERIELGGILWYQGEADDTLEDSATYAERFATWVDAIREQLGSPELPVYVVQLGRLLTTELELAADPDCIEAAWDVLREAQRTAPQRSAQVGVVSAIDLGMVDSVHIDAPGLVRLGRRLARLALCQGRSPNVVRVERAPDADNGLHQVQVVCEGVDQGWTPASHITGFEIRDASGQRSPSVGVVEAHPQPDDPRHINLVLSSDGRFDRDLAVGYGLGFNPPCRAVDAADMPLPAFAAQQVCRPQKSSTRMRPTS